MKESLELKKIGDLRKSKSFGTDNFITFASSIANNNYPLTSHNLKYSHKYYITCLLDYLESNTSSWGKYRPLPDYPITSSYLNAIHNIYCRKGIYDKIFNGVTNLYLKYDKGSKIKIQMIDSTFIQNKQGTFHNDYLLSDEEKQKNIKIREDNENLPINQQKKEKKFIDFNRYNGRKKYFKKDLGMNHFGFIFAHNTSSATRHDTKSLPGIINRLPRQFNTKRNSKVNRHKQYFLGDSGYNSKKNYAYLKEKGYNPLIAYNKKNTKNPNILQKNKMNQKEKNIYQHRHIVENGFAWLKSRTVINIMYQKNIMSYDGLFSLACSFINSKKI